MRRRILIAVAACCYYSGLVALARWWNQRRGPRVIFLVYHRALGGDLRRHWLYLRRHYRLMHVEAALEELYTSRKEIQRGYDRRTALALTFDDGYRDNYTHALPLARELEVPFSIYLVPGYIESGQNFWWVEARRLVKRAQVAEITLEGRTYRLSDATDRAALSSWIDSQARHASSIAPREALLASLRQQLQVPNMPEVDEIAEMPVTWQQVREMEASGWVSFGAHTMNHPVLSAITDGSEVQHEVAMCRKVLETQLGHPVRSFAYPIGQWQHIREDVVQSIKEAGYQWALTTHYGINTPQTNPLLMQRIEVDVDQHWLVMAVEAAGLWGIVSKVRWHPWVRAYLTRSRNKGI